MLDISNSYRTWIIRNGWYYFAFQRVMKAFWKIPSNPDCPRFATFEMFSYHVETQNSTNHFLNIDNLSRFSAYRIQHYFPVKKKHLGTRQRVRFFFHPHQISPRPRTVFYEWKARATLCLLQSLTCQVFPAVSNHTFNPYASCTCIPTIITFS